MKIKKISDEIVYRKTTTEMKFDVGGKEVKVFLYEDSEGWDMDTETEDEQLTDDEKELFGYDMLELYDLKVGEELNRE